MATPTYMSLFDAVKPVMDAGKKAADNAQTKQRAKAFKGKRNRTKFTNSLPENPGMTQFEKAFLATKGGRRRPPSGNWDNPTESNLDWIKRSATTGDALKQREAAVSPGYDLKKAADAVAVQRRVQEQNAPKEPIGPKPVVFDKSGMPVGFSGPAPNVVPQDERSMANREGLFGRDERAKIQQQIMDAAARQPLATPPVPMQAEPGGEQMMSDVLEPFKSQGMPMALPNDTPGQAALDARSTGLVGMVDRNQPPYQFPQAAQPSALEHFLTNVTQAPSNALNTFTGSPFGSAVTEMVQHPFRADSSDPNDPQGIAREQKIQAALSGANDTWKSAFTQGPMNALDFLKRQAQTNPNFVGSQAHQWMFGK